MTALNAIQRENQRLVLRFSTRPPSRVDEYMGGSVLVEIDAQDDVVTIRTARLAPAEVQVISDLLRRYDLSLDPLVYDTELAIA